MDITIRIGRYMTAVAFLAMGVQALITDHYVMRLEPLAMTTPYAAIGAYVSGAIVAAAALLIATAWRPRLGATVLAITLLTWVVALPLPKLISHPTNALAWLSTAEPFALFGAAWALAAALPVRDARRPWDSLIDAGRTGGRLCFGASQLAFGASHFAYPKFVAEFMPAWIPQRLALAWATGAAHTAAGLAILSGVLGGLAAILAGVMYGSWVLLVHIPRVLAKPSDPFEWNGIFVALALSGGAFIVAGSFSTKKG